LAVFNHKGGTGKTTVSAHGRRPAASGNALLVDTDGQGNVATSLGLKFASPYHVIVMGLDYREVVIEARPGLDVVPPTRRWCRRVAWPVSANATACSPIVSPALTAYDFVVVDRSPSLSLMNQNALVSGRGAVPGGV
jgi:chromosome partitioning protein